METLGTSVTYLLGLMGTLVTTIIGNPMFLIGIAFFAIGGVIGLVFRMIHGN